MPKQEKNGDFDSPLFSRGRMRRYMEMEEIARNLTNMQYGVEASDTRLEGTIGAHATA